MEYARKTREGRKNLRLRGKRSENRYAEQKQFIAWDGEGITYTPNTAQSYVLFGASTGDSIQSKELRTIECLELMLETARLHKGIHVGFAFTYDVNMICVDIPRVLLRKLSIDGVLKWKGYRITFLKGKWFEIYHHKTKRNIKLYDVFSFFQTSFVKALKQYLGDLPELVALLHGKNQRGVFEYEQLEDFIKPYWQSELRLLVELCDTLRRNLEETDIHLKSWHGPGAIANSLFKQHDIASHMDRDAPKEVREAAQYAYAGGRFELFYTGKYIGPVYQYDIRSAYPYAITKLPSLKDAVWIHQNGAPNEIKDFALYKVDYIYQMFADAFGMLQNKEKVNINGLHHFPQPFFWRDKKQCIHYPWRIKDTWIWGVELKAVIEMGPSFFGSESEIKESWTLIDNGERPFEFVNELYEQRAQWKRDKNGAQLAAKLAMNSLYGKMAQLVGWNEETNEPPRYHQLEWAGFITATCRSMIFKAMMQHPMDIIAVETDGIYSKTELDLPSSQSLGDWELDIWDGIMYVQNGVYWVYKDGEWAKDGKVRGFDKGTVSPNLALDSLEELTPLQGETTRFVTFNKISDKPNWRVWEMRPHIAQWGGAGKRRHVAKLCYKCKGGKLDFHNLVIAYWNGGSQHKHILPWLDVEKNFYTDTDPFEDLVLEGM